MSRFAPALARANDLVGARLKERLAADPVLGVEQAMQYALAGGKGLRGFLVLESARLHGVDTANAVHAAAAIEAMHTYSLVHDDLPCMDDDDLRRGRPTVHVQWDEATAVLVGDGLQALAFELVSEVEPVERAMILIRSLARSAGVDGMVGGQAMDIAAETAAGPFDVAEVTELQARKTGALFGWSCSVGPVLAGDDASAMAEYSQAIGLAFQIADDILDVTGDEESAGKRVGKDAEAGKATFVAAAGLEGARQMLERYMEQADAALAPYGDDAETLREAARFVISRRN